MDKVVTQMGSPLVIAQAATKLHHLSHPIKRFNVTTLLSCYPKIQDRKQLLRSHQLKQLVESVSYIRILDGKISVEKYCPIKEKILKIY